MHFTCDYGNPSGTYEILDTFSIGDVLDFSGMGFSTANLSMLDWDTLHVVGTALSGDSIDIQILGVGGPEWLGLNGPQIVFGSYNGDFTL